MTQKKGQAAHHAAASASKTAASAAKPALKTVKRAANQAENFFFPVLNGKPDQAMEKFMNTNKAQMEKFAQDASEMGREGMEAFIKSSTLFAKGFEEIMRAASDIAQASAEKHGQFFKEVLSSKTLNEWTDVQNRMAQAHFDDFMAGATQISEISIKALTEAAEPLNEQMTKAMNKASAATA